MEIRFHRRGRSLGLTYIIMALMPGVSGGFITLTLFIVALMLVFLLSMIITYPAIWLFRYV